MRAHRCSRFESLEQRLALAVTATVTDGDLIVRGDADGAVQIVAVGAGSYEVRDNGALIADSTTLTGANDDIRINIDATAGADNVVTLDLNSQTVDRVYAKLGNGANSLQLTNGNAASFVYHGGSGDDAVTIAADASVTGHVGVWLGGGDNSLTVNGAIGGHLFAGGGSAADTVLLADTSSVAKNAFLALGGGNNNLTAAGSIGRSLIVDGRDGYDVLTIAATANITDNFFARLGRGDNSVAHNGTVGGNFKVVSKNANDTVAIADTAVIGGETKLGLGEQRTGHGRFGGPGPGWHGPGDMHLPMNTPVSAKSSSAAAAKTVTAAALSRVAQLLLRR